MDSQKQEPRKNPERAAKRKREKQLETAEHGVDVVNDAAADAKEVADDGIKPTNSNPIKHRFKTKQNAFNCLSGL